MTYAYICRSTYEETILENKQDWTLGEICRLLEKHTLRLVKENTLNVLGTGNIKIVND